MILRDNEIRKYLMLYSRELGHVLPVVGASFELGRMCVALSIESQARIFEELDGTSLIALNRIEIASALRNVLRSLGIDDDVLDVYDRLVEMKAKDVTSYVAVEDDSPEHASDDVDPLDTVLRREWTRERHQEDIGLLHRLSRLNDSLEGSIEEVLAASSEARRLRERMASDPDKSLEDAGSDESWLW